MKLLNKSYITILVLSYIGCVFIELDINFNNWSKDTRIIGIILYTFVITSYFMIKDTRKN